MKAFLIDGLLKKDEEVYIFLMEKYSKLLWQQAWKILNGIASVHDIEDCISEVFFKLWKNPENFDPKKSNIKNYLVTVTKNAAIDIYRKKVRLNETELIEDITHDCDILTGIISNENTSLVLSAIEDLNSKDREIIIRRFVKNEKPAEISREMNLPVRKVENRLYRAKLELRKRLAGME